MEREKRRNPGIPYKVSEDPFAQNLANLAEEKGFSSLSALARELRVKRGVVHGWYSGSHVPSSDYMGALLIVLNLDEQQTDVLIDSWAVHLQNGRGIRGRMKGDSNPERSFKTGQAHMKQNVDLPLSRWINRMTLDRHITQKRLTELLGLNSGLLSSAKLNSFSIFTLGTILENATPSLNLTEDEERNLADVICDTFNQQLTEGRRMLNYYSSQGKIYKNSYHVQLLPVVKPLKSLEYQGRPSDYEELNMELIIHYLQTLISK